MWIYATIGPAAVLVGVFLGWVTVYPYRKRRDLRGLAPVHPPRLGEVSYRRVGVAVEFTPGDDVVLRHAARLAKAHGAPLVLIHVVEGAGASLFGAHTDDRESRQDREAMGEMVAHLQAAGIQAEGTLGYGSPPAELVRLARDTKLDVLVLGMHGHRFLADLALGETVSPVLHRLPIPVLVVPPGGRE
jgi:manganese transport protein